jgi:cytochrome o ubiquinol oxidase subunit IV
MNESLTYKSYVLGFFLSIVLTLGAYFLVVERLFTAESAVYAIIGLGIVQALIQLVLFLHLGRESRPRWNMLVFLFMVMVIVIIVGGSLWIMDNLDYRVMS